MKEKMTKTVTEPWLIVILGPTAIGKTSLSIEVARRFGSEIISADSRQCYREMRIGTAVPSSKDLGAVPHHFIGHLSVRDDYNAGMFEQDVLSLLPALFGKHRLVFMTGGSGLYINAVCSGIDEFPEVDPDIRESLREMYGTGGLDAIRAELRERDPQYYGTVDLSNPRRILKALEVCRAGDKPYSAYLTGRKKDRDFNILKIGLRTGREQLYGRIDRRVDRMIREGLVDEVRSLSGFRDRNALHTVGYREIFRHLDGEIPLEEAIRLIKVSTRRYARRQMTWFRRDSSIRWFDPGDAAAIIDCIEQTCR